MGNLLLFELKDRIRGILGWGIGLIAFAGLYISVYPQVAQQMADLADLDIYAAMGMELGTFEGYISSVVLGFLPILLGVYAVMMGTKTLAGEEEAGTLELLMARPLLRWQIVTVKALAMGIIFLVVLTIASIGDVLILAGVKGSMANPPDIEPISLGYVIFSAWPITMTLAMIGLFLGAFLPSRRLAAALTGLVLAVGYFGENMAGMVDNLESIKPMFLFSYYDSSSAVFTEGVAGKDLLVLFSLIIVFFLGALVSFQYRNVSVGNWIWQRGKES